MENPAERLGMVIRGIDDTIRDVDHDDAAGIFPILNGKVLDVNVKRAFSRNFGVDHFDGRHVVIVERSGFHLAEAQFSHDGTQVLRMFGSQDRAKNSASVELVASVKPMSWIDESGCGNAGRSSDAARGMAGEAGRPGVGTDFR